jgi:hypothetical protein
MRYMLSALFVVTLACLLPLASGCGKGTTKVVHRGGEDTGGEDTAAEKMTPVASKGWATIKGKVTLDGDPPEKVILEDVKKHAECMAKDAPEYTKIDQTWLVGPDSALPNVAIWVKAPKGQYFKLKKEQTDLKGKVVKLEQPHCAFEPHVLALFPSYYDGEEQKSTGQKFEVVNNAKFPHNTLIEGDALKNPTWNSGQIPGDKNEVKEVPARKPQDTPLNVKCDIHSWMRAKIWVFDNPYHAVTGKDGTFEIKNVPAGVKLHIVAWHEGGPQEWRLPEMNPSAEGMELTLKDGQTKELNFKVKRK